MYLSAYVLLTLTLLKRESSDAGSLAVPKRNRKVSVCMGKNTECVGFGAICGFRHPLECIPHG